MVGIIDADTHIAEPREMWNFLDPEWYPKRPVVVEVPGDTLYQKSNHMWLIDGNIYPKAAGKGGMLLVTPTSQARNQDLADVCHTCSERLKWVVVPPLRHIDATIQEMRFGKAHGAVGVFFRGIEKDRTLDDPYFFPVYEEAQTLDL